MNMNRLKAATLLYILMFPHVVIVAVLMFFPTFFFSQGREKGEVEVKDSQSVEVSGKIGESSL